MTPTVDDALAEQIKLAAQVYLYGYSLVYNMREIANFASGQNTATPQSLAYNTFGAARKLLDPNTKFVSPNNDTLYLMAMCDVRDGPLVLHVPETHDRYYVLQFIDAWTNNFAYIGRRICCASGAIRCPKPSAGSACSAGWYPAVPPLLPGVAQNSPHLRLFDRACMWAILARVQSVDSASSGLRRTHAKLDQAVPPADN